MSICKIDKPCRLMLQHGSCKLHDCPFNHSLVKLGDGPNERPEFRENERPPTNQNNQTKQKNRDRNDNQHRNNQNKNGRGGRGDRPRLKKVNTESFDPSHKPADMRIKVESGLFQSKTGLTFQQNDVVVVPGLFGESHDQTIYTNLLKEMDECGVSKDKLWKLWHGDSHLIADDHMNYKEKVPTFMMVINKIRDYFNMDIKATRFNWYRDDVEWKPFHHDASAVDPAKAKIQNFTVGVSFGATRDIAFEDAVEPEGHRRIISIPLVNGTTYAFAKDININWRHGVPQLPPAKQGKEGRISVIAWGSVEQAEI